ncbi:MAG TPA: U32 family peptidase [Novimethylophilus sp.]|uniref:U32 family peptidase n=1 Tax=Novimethylophilus sp. TaxID=2137426 RepID=UPI002F3EE58B
MKISLGPILYYWQREELVEFYRQAATWPVDIVYLGETVCSRRHAFRIDDWLEAAEQLALAGKEVVLSTQALVESESDLKTLRRLAANGKFAIEANDMGAVHAAAGAPFVAGPHLNTYNQHTLEVLAEAGATRWVMPVEMSRQMLADVLAHKPGQMQTEVFAYGRLPLAFSARCFTARRYNLPKDDCQFRCQDHPEGLALKTRDGQPFLALNGIQTQSASIYNLAAELGEMTNMGVDVVRISPHAGHTGQVVELFRQCLDGGGSAETAAAALQGLLPDADCDGYWHGKPGIEQSLSSTAMKRIA